MELWVLVNFSAAVAFQAVAALTALSEIRRAGRHNFRFAWICVSLALLIMLQRRVLPIYEIGWTDTHTSPAGALELLDSSLALLISGLMALGMRGLRALFLTLESQAEALRALAELDELTKLRNRRSMHRDALREVQRVPRSGQPLSAIMLDLDRFKRINDQHGHAAGDAVLVSVAEVMKGQLRDIDLCARWGGEEFLVLLPNADADQAIAVAERLRGQLESLRVIHGSAWVLAVTGSFGTATLSSLTQAPATAFNELVRGADQALYRAKASGGNCTVHQPSAETE